MAVGGAVSVDKAFRKSGLSWWAEEELSQADVSHICRPGNVDVILAHDCPLGVNIPGIGPDLEHRPPGPLPFPYPALLDADRHRRVCRTLWEQCQPDMWIHGHYHVPHEAGMLREDGAYTRVIGLDCDATHLGSNVTLLGDVELDG